MLPLQNILTYKFFNFIISYHYSTNNYHISLISTVFSCALKQNATRGFFFGKDTFVLNNL